MLVTSDPAAAEQCAVIRALGGIPLLVAGSSLSADSAAACLDAGADAVVGLPLSDAELDAHIQAVLRRSEIQDGAAPVRQIRAGSLTIDTDTHTVWQGEKEVNLSPTEFNLLAALAESPGSVVSNEELLTRVWGPEYADDVHYVRLYIGYLRAKLEADPRHPTLIVNQWGVGYRLATTPGEPSGAAYVSAGEAHSRAAENVSATPRFG